MYKIRRTHGKASSQSCLLKGGSEETPTARSEGFLLQSSSCAGDWKPLYGSLGGYEWASHFSGNSDIRG